MADQTVNTTAELAIGVAGLSDYLKLLLEEDDRLRNLWVVGEISSANSHRQGCFFTLQEPDGSAAINCVVWKSQLPRLTTLPKIGEQVTVLRSDSPVSKAWILSADGLAGAAGW